MRHAIAIVVLAGMIGGCQPTFCINCRHIYQLQQEQAKDGQSELDRIYRQLEEAENGNSQKNAEK